MSSVIIKGESRQHFIKIERLEYENRYPSYHLAISVNQAPFQGAINIWSEAQRLQSFLEQLRECERTRRGEATLASMSPNEFSLRIFNTASKGDFALTYAIRVNGGSFPIQLQGGFDFDPSMFRQILVEFSGIIAT